jgi:hypothetical protein
MRMKANGSQDSAGTGHSNSWNARRSYNLLRLSLSHPTTLSAADLDTDLEMDIDEDEEDSESEHLQSSFLKNNKSEQISARLPLTDEKDIQAGVKDRAAHEGLLSADHTRLGNDTDDDIVNFASGSTQSPEKVATPEVMKIPESRILRALQSPPESVSPRLLGMSGSPLQHGPASNIPPANSTCAEIFHSTQERFCDGTSSSESFQLNNDATRRSFLRASMSTARPTEKLAACLQRGLQILDSHQRSSISIRRSPSTLRSSIHANDIHLPRMFNKVDKGVQTSPVVLVTTSTSPMSQVASQPAVEAVSTFSFAELFPQRSPPPEFSCGGAHDGQLPLCVEMQGNTLKDLRDDVQFASPASLREMGEEFKTRSDSPDASLQLSIVTQQDQHSHPEDKHASPSTSGAVQESQTAYPQLSIISQPFRGCNNDPNHSPVDVTPLSRHETSMETTSKEHDTSNWHLATTDAASFPVGSPRLKEVTAIDVFMVSVW